MKMWCAQFAESGLNRFNPSSIIGVHRIEDFDPGENDVAVFLGGGDIHPSLYGHAYPLSMARTGLQGGPTPRDVLEMQMVYRCVEKGIKMIGFCRGAQLLCIAAGGTLVQHIDNHVGNNHPLILHTGKIISCNSVHHQMMRLRGTEHVLLGWAPNLSKSYEVDPAYPVGDGEFAGGEPEIVYFPLINSLGFQFHPEYDFTSEFGRLAADYIYKYILGSKAS